jgi:RNA polymerase sigma-70 factor (ECF subfamily)
LAHIKRSVQPRQYEIYYLHVILGQSVPDVAKALAISSTQVYLAKHRVGRLIKKEVVEMKKTLSY